MGTEIKFNPETGIARDSDGNQIGRAAPVKADPSPLAPGRITFGPMTGGEATTLKGQPLVKPNNSAEYRVDINQAIAEAKTEAEAIIASAQTSSGSPLMDRRPLSAKDTVVIEGMRTTVAAAAAQGYLTLDDNGRYVPTEAPAEDTASAKEVTEPEFVELDDDGEASMGLLVSSTSQGDQMSALNSFIKDGEVSETAINRLASSAGIEPQEAAAHVAKIQSAYEGQMADVLAKEGVHDYDLFREWMWSDPSRAGEADRAIREMVLSGPASGFKGLAQSFTAALDTVDPEAVTAACEEAGVQVRPQSEGKGLLLTMPDGREVTWSVAVKMGLFRVRRA